MRVLLKARDYTKVYVNVKSKFKDKALMKWAEYERRHLGRWGLNKLKQRNNDG